MPENAPKVSQQQLAELCHARDTLCNFCEADECDGCMVSRLINDAFNEAGNPDMQEDD